VFTVLSIPLVIMVLSAFSGLFTSTFSTPFDQSWISYGNFIRWAFQVKDTLHSHILLRLVIFIL
jgi:hypothetical protein